MEQQQPYTLGRTERLKSRKLIQQLFVSGTVVTVPPFRISYLELEQPGLQLGVGVGTRHFKKAVHRNRVKRLIRESYRLQKTELQQLLLQKQKGLAVFFVFIGKEIPSFTELSMKMKQALEKLQTIAHAFPQATH